MNIGTKDNWRIIFCIFLTGVSQFVYSQVDIGNFECFKYSGNKSFFQETEHNPFLDNYDVKFYKLDIEANNDSVFVKGNVLINALVINNPLDTFVIELNSAMTVDSVKIDENLYSFSHYGDYIYVSLFPSQIEAGSIISVRIFYSGPFGIGGYYSMLADIKEAAGLPKPPISRVEFELKTNRYAELIKDLEDKYTEEKQKREELEQELKDFKETYYENR